MTAGTVSSETTGLTAPIRDAMGTAVAAVGMVTPVETFRPLVAPGGSCCRDRSGRCPLQWS
ncbi:hypothetical protein ACFU6I_25510 [Streptomyces sp. NPDC057486]|uniref:hypothetical protein n=1 Tax=Streptomyces sp. NPDC057486 TaxID=3346145 RepID=UPI0036BAA227